jgi:2-C-methyl-D-erythritol 4-phosphate cytidylyltransferase/2-C-methyl-D-erythritol 2,4-cyclodiphosphate synthase
MVEYLGKDVYILEGDYKNIKITTKNDLDVARAYLK